MSLSVAKVTGLATIQDLGRPGRMHEGVPPGGALVPDLLAAANLALGNEPGAAAVEIFGGLEVVPAEPLRLSVDGQSPVDALPGERFKVSAQHHVSYLAVAGGIDAPIVLGGRGTLLVAGIGGLEGRPLREGDALPVAPGPTGTPVAFPPPDLDVPVRVISGPDLDRFEPNALGALFSEPFALSPVGDRAGRRLDGPPLGIRGGAGARSTPMISGAIQVTPSGEAIVLGPDHPTTGGYPVLAVVIAADRGAFFARRALAAVSFAACTIDVARRALFTRRERYGF